MFKNGVDRDANNLKDLLLSGFSPLWKEHNEERPHSSLGYKTPKEFAAAEAASFYRAELGQEASNAGPSPRPPSPLKPEMEQNDPKPEN